MSHPKPPHLAPFEANSIVAAITRDTGYHINLMDHCGVIIASSDPQRIGETHRGAVRALALHEPVEIATDGDRERAGINLPLDLDGYWFGVVGITGAIENVRPLARIVRTAVLMLVRQRQSHDTETLHTAVIATLRHDPPPYADEVHHVAATAGIDLSRPVQIVTTSATTPPPTPHLGLGNGEWLIQADTPRDALTRWADTTNAPTLLSRPHRSVTAAVQDIAYSQPLAHLLRHGPGLVSTAPLATVRRLSQEPLPPTMDSLDAHPDLITTLHAYYRHDLALQQTAHALHIHRNTLTYRLERIEHITTFDPRRTINGPLFLGYLARHLATPRT